MSLIRFKTYIQGSLMLKFVYVIGYPAIFMKVKKYDKSIIDEYCSTTICICQIIE